VASLNKRWILLGLLALVRPVLAYDLFHPVPAAQMPELSPDRPDKTEGYTIVPAGHWQLESDLAVVTRDQANGLRTEDWSSLDFNLKAGLAEGLDIQFVHSPLLRGSAEDLVNGGSADYAGRGDSLIRVKIHLREPDGLVPGMGLLPFVKFPTASEGLGNGQTEGGLIIPVGWELPAGWGLSAMLELDANADSAGSGRHIDTVLSASADHKVLGPLDGYVELWGQFSGEGGVDNVFTADGGLTLGLGANAQADLGLNAGLNDAAPDLEPFLGITFRL
jgi:hypothetical protein